MMNRQALLDSIAHTIADYRLGEIPQPDAEHVQRWVEQFNPDSQIAILRETDYVLKNTYIRRESVEGFIRNLIVNAKLVGNDYCKFWSEVGFLNIQQGGRSQKEMLEIFSTELSKQCGFNVQAPSGYEKEFIYLDDIIFSGGRVWQDISKWIRETDSYDIKIHIITIGYHRYGQWYQDNRLQKLCKSSNKKVEFQWWRGFALEDRRKYINDSDVLRPRILPNDQLVIEYANFLQQQGHPVHYRTSDSIGEHKLFSSEAGRHCLEQNFLIAGAHIRSICPNLNKYQRPLGNMMLDTLGFGSLLVTYRNCPNNTPLAFWVSDPWYPLFPRKNN